MRGTFWTRSVRRRPAAFACLVALSAIAMIVSVLAPMLFRAVQQVTLAEAVQNAGPDGTALVAQASTQAAQSAEGLGAALAVSSAVSNHLWQRPVTLTESDTPYGWDVTGRAGRARQASIVAADSSCGGATLVTGRCVTDGSGIVVPQSTARANGIRVGDVVDLTDLVPEAPSTAFTVTGIYRDSGRTGNLLAGPGRRFGAGGGGSSDFVVSLEGFDSIVADGTSYSIRYLRHPPTLGEIPEIRSDIRAARASTLTSDGASASARFTSGITGVLDRIGPQHDAAGVILAVTAVQALGLAWFAEGLVIQRIGRVRATEWGLGRLRGLPRRRWLGAVFLEPGVAVVIGAVVGFGVGVAASAVAARTVLGGTASVEPWQPLVLAAAGLSLVGSLVALVAASVRSARLPLVDLLRATAEPRLLSRTAVVVQAGAVLVTVTVLASLVTVQEVTGPGVALLAPSLVAVLIGIVGLRVAVLVIRRRTKRPPRSLGGVLIGRQLGRSPSVLSAAVMVTVGVAIAVYASQTAVVGTRLQDDRTAATLGAATVLDVSVPGDVTLLDAVRRADPDGRTAMAAEVLTSGTGVGRLVAVDTARLGAVSSWDTAWSGRSASELTTLLDPAASESLTLRGSELRLTLADVRSASISTDQSAVALQVVVQNGSGWQYLDFGSPRDGTLTEPIRCADGCRLVSIGITSTDQYEPPYSSAFTLTGIATDRLDRGSTASWLAPSRWRNRIGDSTDSQQRTRSSLSRADTAGARGLAVSLTDSSGSHVASIAPRDAPEPIPALLGRSTGTAPFPGIRDAVSGVGPDQSPRILRVVGHTDAVPRVLGDGAMIDLGVADRVTDPAASLAQHEVWLAPGSHPDVLAKLRADGIRVTATHTLADAERRADRAAPTLGSVLGLPIAAGALGLTLLALVAVRVIGADGRRRDWVSLRSAGLSAARLRRVLTLDALLPTGIGALLGVAAGVAAFAVTIARLPLLSGESGSPPPDLAPGVLPIVALVVGELALLATIAVVGARLELRDATHRTGGTP
ncbi:FtsX-like permease family protein [Curtobacterium sp. Leaf261]|uniref:FtsX-like permease family protein n=1 Tax=Curtobacterium sp. Leaf261 TaxID=1736311 RepID=UPI0006F43C3D|nr:FtsX-like permease family protein [Curtobacterium sp. Leaf261]KQO62720.1 hypothetical protein ASF23_07080 [Curtobacterium sp. Leaf261]